MTAVTLLYFAQTRELVGLGEEKRILPDTVRTARDVAAWLATLGAGHGAAFAAPEKLRCAIDQVMAPLDTPVAGAREIAFFPPVTGG